MKNQEVVRSWVPRDREGSVAGGIEASYRRTSSDESRGRRSIKRLKRVNQLSTSHREESE